MKERVERMALRTWDVIGGDCLQALEECGEKPVMPKDHVIETVCDAGYMKMYGRDDEAYEYWNNLSTYEEKMAAVKDAFKFASYGW